VRATRACGPALAPLGNSDFYIDGQGKGRVPFPCARSPKTNSSPLLKGVEINGHNDQAPILERYVFVADRGCSYRFRFMFRRPLVEVVSGWSALGAAAEIATAAFAASA